MISLFECVCLVGSKNTLGDQLRTVEFSRLALFLYPPFVKNDYLLVCMIIMSCNK